MEELEEELEEESEGPSMVSIMEARLLASMSTGANFDEPRITAGAVGAAVKSTVLSMEATVSTLEAKSSSSTLTGAKVEEPWIVVEAGRGVLLESTVLSMEAWAVARESSSAVALPLGLCPASKAKMDRSSAAMEGQVTLSDCIKLGHSSQSNSMVAMALRSASDVEIRQPSTAFQSILDMAARPR